VGSMMRDLAVNSSRGLQTLSDRERELRKPEGGGRESKKKSPLTIRPLIIERKKSDLTTNGGDKRDQFRWRGRVRGPHCVGGRRGEASFESFTTVGDLGEAHPS